MIELDLSSPSQSTSCAITYRSQSTAVAITLVRHGVWCFQSLLEAVAHTESNAILIHLTRPRATSTQHVLTGATSPEKMSHDVQWHSVSQHHSHVRGSLQTAKEGATAQLDYLYMNYAVG